jgi:adenine-specific DNA methylase
MATKKELLAHEIAQAVGAGKPVALATVDFNDPSRPKTCLEVDFPVLSINQIAQIEGNAGKPIYQMSKWWARRRSSVFRSMLIAAATKAPDDHLHAAKLVWDNYYANHQKKGAFQHLKVVDIFMGGGTTVVEGSRLGMQMIGNDLSPVAWFVVKQEVAAVDIDQVKQLIAGVEAEVKPQITPFYYCDGPNGEKGVWSHNPTRQIMGADFDPLSLTPDQRNEYSYQGPEVIYTFWAKHGPCQVTGCGHRTPIMTSPVMAVKTLTVTSWLHSCGKCREEFSIEDKAARIAPDVPLYVSPSEAPFSVIDPARGSKCPHCGFMEMVRLGKGENKKVELTLLVHPDWLAGSSKEDVFGRGFGGSVEDEIRSTESWNVDRASKIRLLEVRGTLPDEVTCPATGVTFRTGKNGGTVPKRSHFTCAACGTVQDVLETTRAHGETAPVAAYAVQGFSAKADARREPYGGRFFAEFGPRLAEQYNAAAREWESRKNSDLLPYWPKSEIPIGAEIGPHDVEGHHFTHWWKMFSPRQLLVHAQLLKAILTVGNYNQDVREYVLAAFQQYLRNQCMFSFWHLKLDKLAPALSNSNFHPKANVVEVGVFPPMGYGPWSSTFEVLFRAANWSNAPWEIVSASNIKKSHPALAARISGKSEKTIIGDQPKPVSISCGSSTDLSAIPSQSIDMVVTDPPFGNLLQYSELADFFYVWLRLALAGTYSNTFGSDLSPKALEAVSNSARHPDDPDGFYQRLLTECWTEAHRILKPGGILAFTFHHSEDAPWVAVLESLFDSGFYLEATYPVRSDETKGDGDFGSKTIEYDIIHVCRKRVDEPKQVSWARMRREVLSDVRHIETMLENHARDGLPSADLQVIRRGKALEYFSRHYGKVLVDEEKVLSVSEALLGINQLIEETTEAASDLPPANANPLTRQFLRIFRGKTEVDRDQIQKFLKGSGITPDEFGNRGWSVEESKRFHLVPAVEFAAQWRGRQRKNLTYDYDQAWLLIGACLEGSGINAAEQLRNENFKPHPALKGLLEWLGRNGYDALIRQSAIRAVTIYNAWADSNRDIVRAQLELFDDVA